MRPGIYGGRLEVFSVTQFEKANRLGHLFQTPTGWSPWSFIGPEMLCTPSVFQNGDGRLEVFGATFGGLLGHTYQRTANDSSSWSSWENLGPKISGGVAAYRDASTNGIAVFANDASAGTLGWMAQWAPWSPWRTGLGPAVIGSPAVCTSADGCLHLFGTVANSSGSTSGQLGFTGMTSTGGTWKAWKILSSSLLNGAPSVFQDANGCIQIFGVDAATGKIGNIRQLVPDNDAKWSSWTVLSATGPVVSTAPAVFQNTDGRLEVFATDVRTGALGHMFQVSANGGWSTWNILVPTVKSAPAVFVDANGSLEVFASGSNGHLGFIRQTKPAVSTGWSPWVDLGAAISMAPIACQNGSIGTPTAPSATGPASNSNTAVTDYGTLSTAPQVALPLIDLSVTIEITQDIVSDIGFSFQLNAWPPAGNATNSSWQQFFISTNPKQAGFESVWGSINLFGGNAANEEDGPFVNLFKPAPLTMTAGTKLTIALLNDENANVTGAKFTVVLPPGQMVTDINGNQASVVSGTIDLLKSDKKFIAPIVAAELVLVGPLNSAKTTLASGACTVTYTAANVLAPANALPDQAAGKNLTTAEQANSQYGGIVPSSGTVLTQQFIAAKEE